MLTERQGERELLELFEAAKKAADAAEEDGVAEESRCLDALVQLKAFPVTIQLLVSTQVGKHLRPLTKHPRRNIQDLASDVFALWKKVVLEQTHGDKNSVKAKPGNAENVKPEKLQKTTPVKVEKFSKNAMVKVEKINQNGAPRSAKVVKSETAMTSHNPSAPVGCIPKCNDALRDRIREQIYEALYKVSGEAEEDSWGDVNACDPIQVAVSVESVLFKHWGRSNGSHKVKYRSLMFNIKDAKNPDFRRKILLGQVKAEEIVHLSSEEMASDEMQQKNQQIKEKALFHCELGGAPKATTDQFKCGRCGQRKTTYYQMQTRSADEPMTTYVTCVNCNNHWKFC
ncbi:transcription elongation factor TFIIS isoform X3 [Manihot esculenta]|uniref:Uncharacterized protein n=3 Tax=Manihot esculenta TaxID=3983 RepID=A0ACB7GX66_MANES|nr:transcription elongation factor TFIIS isoform X3 [Manihot esculenta]KAG8644815.1 hypothetical protein MANES_10G002900v8 [Manihot esculenta]OAY38287.1 hypothetical protein MANES_10G002900v8 [Manihot esculenta]